MEILTHAPSYVESQANEIYNTMHVEKTGEFKVTTSDMKDRRKHRVFNNIANELRKKGLKVRSRDNWGTTEWTVYI